MFESYYDFLKVVLIKIVNMYFYGCKIVCFNAFMLCVFLLSTSPVLVLGVLL